MRTKSERHFLLCLLCITAILSVDCMRVLFLDKLQPENCDDRDAKGKCVHSGYIISAPPNCKRGERLDAMNRCRKVDMYPF